MMSPSAGAACFSNKPPHLDHVPGGLLSGLTTGRHLTLMSVPRVHVGSRGSQPGVLVSLSCRDGPKQLLFGYCLCHEAAKCTAARLRAPMD